MHNKYGYVPKGEKNSMSRCVAVRSVVYSMIALLGPLGTELYQMIKGSHNSGTFLKFLHLVFEHLQVTILGVINIIVLDDVSLHKVEDILAEFQVIEPGVEIASQQLAISNLRLLFLPSYLSFLNPIKEVFGWLKQVVKKGASSRPEDLFNLLQINVHTLPAETMAKFYGHSDLFLPECQGSSLQGGS
ncbi:hypothetical protein DSO57_1030151 [Entomophthora muscae]|uniref:Uncharacterized protein n=1 Tax=Entomophthora muscae TaxID=34485 RepID=A0ACC2RRW4_9FUNG|nr:hypothetical protein DSO57_1030151 [Entomophthora muscae]